MDELWKAVATGLVTLTVGFALLQAQLGGRRRRRRREIREELELLDLLNAEHEQVGARIRARLAVKLAQYEPDAATIRRRRYSRISMAMLAVTSLGPGLLLSRGAPAWVVILSALPAGALPNLVENWLVRRHEQQEQDDAVLHLDDHEGATPSSEVDDPAERGASAKTWPSG